MEAIVLLLVHIIVLVLVFGLFYWIVTLICSILPPPIQAIVRTLLLVLLALIAILVLTGDLGFWGTWGLGYGRHHW